MVSKPYAKVLKEAFPHATFVGFTGTPIAETYQTFGDEIDRYTMDQAVADGLTVSIKYHPRIAKPVKDAKPNPAAQQCRGYIQSADKFVWSVDGDRIVAFPTSHDISRIRRTLDVIHAGVEVARMKGRDLLPTQSLAMSRVLNREAFSLYEVDYMSAIGYLRREAVTLQDAPTGYVLLTYKDTPLGFVKNLGRRANNLYPQQWRILSSHIPAESVSLF